MSRSRINWNIFYSIYYNRMNCFILNRYIVLIINMNYMSSIIRLNCFLNIFKYSFVSFRNNIKRNVCYICYFYCFNFSLNFWMNWLSFCDTIWACLLNWNICFILNLDWLYCLIFVRNIV